MALNNTSDRYNYIFGSTARQLEPVRLPREQEAAPVQAVRVRKRRKGNPDHALDFDWKYTLIVSLAVMVLMFCAILYVSGTVRLHQLSTRESELKQEKTRLLSKEAALKSEIDKMTNLDQIRSYARSKLGMVYPDQDHIIYYTDSNDDYVRQFESVAAE